MKAFKMHFSWPRLFIFSFGLSLIANYCGVFLLTQLGWYRQVTLMVVLLLEIILLVILYGSQLKPFLNHSLMNTLMRWSDSTWNVFTAYIQAPCPDNNSSSPTIRSLYILVRTVILTCALLSLLYAIWILFKHTGTIFNSWDAIVSWNRWAVDWSHGIFPQKVQHYPQLLPANWSISYVLLNHPLQFFPKFIMPLFLLFLLLGMLDLGLAKRSTGILLGTLLTVLVFRKVFGGWIAEGYADVPAAFFAFISVYSMMLARECNQKSEIYGYLLLAAVFACGAAVTKQAGIFLLMAFPFLLFALMIGNRVFEVKDGLKILLWFLGAVAVIALPFYLYAQFRIKAGIDKSEVAFVTQTIFHGKSLLERSMGALQLLASSLGSKLLLGLMMILSAVALLDRTYRWVVLLITVPFLVLWSMYFSYDIRNCALALPFLTLGAGIGLERGVQITASNKMKNYIVVGCGLILITALNWMAAPSILVGREDALERHKYDPVLGQALYDYQHANGLEGEILTDYIILGFMPGLSDHYRYQFFVRQYGNEFEVYSKNRQDPSVTHILANDNADPAILADIQKRITLNEYKPIFHLHGYVFIKIQSRSAH